MSLRSRSSLGDRRERNDTQDLKGPSHLPTSDPGPTHLGVCLLWGVEEVLLAVLARMASGENEGLHGVGKTSRMSKQWGVHGEELWEQHNQPCPCVGSYWTQAMKCGAL